MFIAKRVELFFTEFPIYLVLFDISKSTRATHPFFIKFNGGFRFLPGIFEFDHRAWALVRDNAPFAESDFSRKSIVGFK